MRRLTEAEGVARLRRGKAAFRTHLKLNFEHRALDCRVCPTPGACCTDAHFVNVHITRLEAVAIRETLGRTPRLNEDERRAVYARARDAVARYGLGASGDTFARTYSCPLYEDWADVPPAGLQWREERRLERLNAEVYGAAWEWLPVPVWLTLVDPDSDGAELQSLARLWESRRAQGGRAAGRLNEGRRPPGPPGKNRTLPVLRA
jgi:hypothetical protein